MIKSTQIIVACGYLWSHVVTYDVNPLIF